MTTYQYDVEEFSPEEVEILNRYFTNTDKPVFAVFGLDEVVKGGLFARYSRTHKSLRRLFLDEFYENLQADEETTMARVGTQRAEELYDTVFFGFGDDSVAQVGGAHLACEQSSNLLTKILEWGRLMAYLEQSTRYIAYDARLGGRYRYYRDPGIMASRFGERYVEDLDYTFERYGHMLGELTPHFQGLYPQAEGQSDAAYNAAIKAKVLDNIRGLLPAATISNLGIYGTGQAYENLLLRMRSLGLPEVYEYSDMMLTELRKVIGPFLKRVDLPDRGNMVSSYYEDNRFAVNQLVEILLDGIEIEPTEEVTLLKFDPDAEIDLVVSILGESSHYGEAQLRRRVEVMSAVERLAVLKAYFGYRGNNRRHKPGRQLEKVWYRFELLSNYGAFRDLQRHRMLTISWQSLTPVHGYKIPALITDGGCAQTYEDVLGRQADLYRALCEEFPADAQPQYALGFAFNMRYNIEINARALTHMTELRTQPGGHFDYRLVCQQMHSLVRDVAGHKAIAEMMRWVDYTDPDLGRLAAEERTAKKQAERKATTE